MALGKYLLLSLKNSLIDVCQRSDMRPGVRLETTGDGRDGQFFWAEITCKMTFWPSFLHTLQIQNADELHSHAGNRRFGCDSRRRPPLGPHSNMETCLGGKDRHIMSSSLLTATINATFLGGPGHTESYIALILGSGH